MSRHTPTDDEKAERFTRDLGELIAGAAADKMCAGCIRNALMAAVYSVEQAAEKKVVN